MQPFSPAPCCIITGAFYDADVDRYRSINPPRVDDGSDTERLPVYHQLDVRVDYRFRWGPWRMSAYLDVINAYYAQLQEGLLEYVGPLVDSEVHEKPMSIALREINEGLLTSTPTPSQG